MLGHHRYHIELHALADATKRPILWKRLGNTFIIQWTESGLQYLCLILRQLGLELKTSWLWYHVKLHALANTTKSPNWWKGLVQSTYTLQHHRHHSFTSQRLRLQRRMTKYGAIIEMACWSPRVAHANKSTLHRWLATPIFMISSKEGKMQDPRWWIPSCLAICRRARLQLFLHSRGRTTQDLSKLARTRRWLPKSFTAKPPLIKVIFYMVTTNAPRGTLQLKPSPSIGTTI
jgi:hypothetical protein